MQLPFKTTNKIGKVYWAQIHEHCLICDVQVEIWKNENELYLTYQLIYEAPCTCCTYLPIVTLSNTTLWFHVS